MTQKELIRQEIERRLKYTHDWLRGDEKRHPKQTAISKNYYKMKGDERTLDALLAFIDSLPEEKPSDDLEEAAHHIAIEALNDTKFMTTTMGYVLGKLQDIFIGGAEWKKEQMMKEAVEGVVMNFSSNTPKPQIDVFVDPHKYCSGDKVKIVIIKGND